MSRIVLATPSATFQETFRSAMQPGPNGDITAWNGDLTSGNVDRVVESIAHDHPELVLIGPDLDPSSAFGLAHAFDLLRPEISVILVAQPSPRVLKLAVEHGVRGVIAPDAPEDEMRAAVDKALRSAERRRANLVGEVDSAREGGRVIVVLSPKGGAGKTTVAVNLAVGLASASPREVLLVDGDLQFGDVASSLRLVPELTVSNAAAAVRAGESTTMKVFLTSHPTNVFVLCAPESPGEADDIGTDQLVGAVRQLAGDFRYTVVDTDAGMGEHTLALLELATDVILICTTDVASVRGLRKAIEAIDLLGFKSAARHFVLNRADARVGLTREDIEATIGMPVHVAVPSSRDVPVSMNQGTPILEADTGSPVARSLVELAERFAPVNVQTGPPKRRRWTR